MTETRTQTLADFLLARIAEDEADIGDLANAYPWEPRYGGRRMEWTHDGFMADPRNLLAECEAKRTILTCYSPPEDDGDESWILYCALAQPYADHPDFRQEWRV